jgi:hypothetical protein
MALDFPNSPTVGDEFTGGGFTWTWTGTTWSKIAAVPAGENNFALLVGASGNTTYVLDRTYMAGAYSVTFVNGDSTYDIYAIATDGTAAGYTKNGRLDATADFSEIVVIGAATNERILFTYQGAITAPLTSGDVPVAGAFITSVATSSLPNINDSTSVTGGNFATDVAVAFIGQDTVALPAKSVVRSSSTSLIATRPDAFTTAQSPYSVRVLNPGVTAPTGTNAHILSNAVTAGTAPTWAATSTVYYNLGGNATPAITLVATDSEASDIDYTVASGTIPNGLTLDNETGVITGTYSGAAVEGDSNSVTFRATDAGGNYTDKSIAFVANATPIWTTTAGALTNAQEGSTYSNQLVASTGTVGGALTYSLLSGSLPSGLSLNSTGLISGTNSAAIGNNASFTVRVTDIFGLTADRAFTILTEAATAFFLIGSTTLTSSTTVFDFPNIPTDGTYKHLEIHVSGRTTNNSTDNLTLRINNEASGEYYYFNRTLAVSGNQISTASNGMQISAGIVSGYSGDSSYRTPHIWQIMDYASNDKVHNVVMNGGGPEINGPSGYNQTGLSVGSNWHSLSPVSSIQVRSSGGYQMGVGCRISVYGIKG